MTGNISELTRWIKRQAQELGFELVGVAPVEPPPHAQAYLQWLQKGYAGEMGYLHRTADLRLNPQSLLPGAKSAVVVGLNYKQPSDLPDMSAHFSIYAQGNDYHEVMRAKLKTLLCSVQQEAPDCYGRICVDSAPVLERDFAMLGGLGWFGKNTCLINTRRGSYFFIGVLLLTLELTYDSPAVGGCGTCRKCIDACPTGAIRVSEQPEIDARLCISYLTIESKGVIPEELREPMGDWVFGCDVCQQVCPFNHPRSHQPLRAVPAQEEQFQPRDFFLQEEDRLERVLRMDEEAFRYAFKGSAVKRTKRRGLVRNAAVAAGNSGNPRYLPLLEKLLQDPEPLIREHAEWAIEKIKQVVEGDAGV
jgi:epoxyqueuosine reductase